MCGIFGYIGQKDATPILLKGLSRLEYRGYDSAGIAIVNGGKEISLKKRKGKIKDLTNLLSEEKISGHLGLGHTRWATHGAPNDVNSHPHLNQSKEIAVVHNGIIENFFELKESLIKEGYSFKSETDSEVLVHLIDKFYKKENNLKDAITETIKVTKGAYAVGVIHSSEREKILVARKDSPLVIGVGKKENFISSDVSALLDHTREVIHIENNEIAEITKDSILVTDSNGKEITRNTKHVEWDIEDAEKQGFPHFMLKEIFEQPSIISELIKKRISGTKIKFEELKISNKDLSNIKQIGIVACGTSYHAGMIGRYVIETLTSCPVWVETSSEFRYRDPKLREDTLVILISQSGETADTLAALREVKKQGVMTLAICNVLGSSMENEANGVLYTYAGPEIAVASTKAYTAQLAMLYLFAFYLKDEVSKLKEESTTSLLEEFKKIPNALQKIIEDYKHDQSVWDENVHQFNVRYHEHLNQYFKEDPEDKKRAPNAFFLYLGRNINYPSALEGALKLKEIAYISAEGYPAGEMKHGPIALIDENPWVICIAVESKTKEKMISNIQEIKARGGIITAIITQGDQSLKDLDLYLYIEVPKINELFSPFVVAIPLQLIAYGVAKEFKEEIDQPRNLAKSVTVE